MLLIKKIISLIKKIAKNYLRKLGYSISSSSSGFIDTKITINNAKKAGLSVNDYIELTVDNPLKKGRRDRVILKLQQAGILTSINRVCEIGPGTGRYLEKIIELGKPNFYEIYETHSGWENYLKSVYQGLNGCSVIINSADGVSLRNTQNASCDLVHAHAVFVYIPLINVLKYLKECIRVCKKNGFVVFDYFPAEDFDTNIANKWLNSPHAWPVLIPKKLINDMFMTNNFIKINEFTEVYGEHFCNYLIWKKE